MKQQNNDTTTSTSTNTSANTNTTGSTTGSASGINNTGSSISNSKFPPLPLVLHRITMLPIVSTTTTMPTTTTQQKHPTNKSRQQQQQQQQSQQSQQKVSSNSIDNNNNFNNYITLYHVQELLELGPIEIVAAAVQYDERMTNNISLVSIPLETGGRIVVPSSNNINNNNSTSTTSSKINNTSNTTNTTTNDDIIKFVYCIELLYNFYFPQTILQTIQYYCIPYIYYRYKYQYYYPLLTILFEKYNIVQAINSYLLYAITIVQHFIMLLPTRILLLLLPPNSIITVPSSTTTAPPTSSAASGTTGSGGSSVVAASTTTGSSTSTSTGSSNNAMTKNIVPVVQPPITPIIVSGLLSILRLQQQQQLLLQVQQQKQQQQSSVDHSLENTNNSTTSTTNTDIISELLWTCQTMRRSSIQQIQKRSKIYTMYRYCIVLVLLLYIFISFLQWMSIVRIKLINLGYIKSCDDMPAYAPACLLAEAILWYKYRDYLLLLRHIQKDCTSTTTTKSTTIQIGPCIQQHPLLYGRYREAPFALHSTFIQDIISLDELDTGIYIPSSTSRTTITTTTTTTTPSPGPTDVSINETVSTTTTTVPSLRWLGETTINRLVREAIDEYLVPTDNDNDNNNNNGIHILDAGCGIGGTLYSLLPEYTYPNELLERNFTYHGITSSGAEIAFARGLLSYNNLDKYNTNTNTNTNNKNNDSTNNNNNNKSNKNNPKVTTAKDNIKKQHTKQDAILFEQKSFEEKLQPNMYNVVLAIESLSFSRNIENTITNLIRSLDTNGILIIMDDVVYPILKVATDEYTIRPSLYSHSTWKSLLHKNKCTLVKTRDLSLEYEMIHDPVLTTIPTTTTSTRSSSSSSSTSTSISGSMIGTTTTSVNGGQVYTSKEFFNTKNKIQQSRISSSSSSSTSNVFNMNNNNYYYYKKYKLWTSSLLYYDNSIILFIERLLAIMTSNIVSHRLLDLYDELYLYDNLVQKRYDAYRRSILSYNMYVCKKQ